MNAEKETYKIAILSDLHVDEGDATSSESWLSTSTPADPSVNPFNSLHGLIESDSLSADILLCCGDLANKANFSGQQFAWKSVHELAEKLGDARVIGTAGNHDLDSRFSQSEFDPKGNLLSLAPEFPGLNDSYSNKYWARNYAIHTLEENSIRILNINSCAFHGYGKTQLEEFVHGRISEPTLNAIKTEIKDQQYSVNIALFHHHPMKWDNIDEDDYSDMNGGNKLLELLETSDTGCWLIIHGHKHVSNISYAAGGSSSPVIFSSGSFSSKRLATNAHRNEFYLIEIEVNPMVTAKLPIAGTVRSWGWQYKSGWSPSHMNCRVPDNGGFGNRTSPEILAGEISEIVRNSDQPWLTWNEVSEALPGLRYVLPSDLNKTLRTIKKSAEIGIAYDDMGWPSQFSVQEGDRGESCD